MSVNKSRVGIKYFRYHNDKLEIIRVINDKNPNSIKCGMEWSMVRMRLSEKELLDNYTKLTPDGVIYFNIVNVGEIQDTMVMMYRRCDIEENKSTPYIVCRQNITDLFANTIKPDYNNLIVGLAVSEESLPENVSMDTILACDGIVKTDTVWTYMDDTLDDILSFVKAKSYDTILYNLFVDHVKYKYKENASQYMQKDIVDGYSKTLRGLMADNEFMYEFCRGYGIYPVTFEITDDELSSNKLKLSHTITMSNILMRKIQNTFLVKYDKDIELDKIEKDYFIIRDCKEKMYIVTYSYSGFMRVPVESIESPENIAKLAKLPGYSNIADIKDAIRFSTNKYQ